jgi:hypothetical protein
MRLCGKAAGDTSREEQRRHHKKPTIAQGLFHTSLPKAQHGLRGDKDKNNAMLISVSRREARSFSARSAEPGDNFGRDGVVFEEVLVPGEFHGFALDEDEEDTF